MKYKLNNLTRRKIMTEIEVSQMLREKAEVVIKKGERICYWSQVTSRGKGSFSAHKILGKTDEEIREWMRRCNIQPEIIRNPNDLFW